MADTENATRGIMLLDRENPNWRGMIDWDRLSMSHDKQCILGQVYGDYNYGLSILGLDWSGAETHGFICELDDPYVQDEDGTWYCKPCRDLGETWKALA